MASLLPAARTSRASTRGLTTEQSISRIQELQQLRREFGAPGIEEAKPGLFMRIVDILSRPNYAIAGFADELFQRNSITSAFSRSFEEFFSGVPGLAGKKEAWGEVLEQAGIGTYTLGQAVPLLEGTWIGAAGLRGATGLALDIFTDPLSYLNFGTKLSSKLASSAGRVFALTPQGERALKTFKSTFKGSDGKTMKEIADAAFSGEGLGTTPREFQRVAREAEEAFLGLHAPDDAIQAGSAHLFDPGGVKFATLGGKPIVTIVSGDKMAELVSYVGSPMAAALQAIPGGERVMTKSVEFGRAFTANFRKLFSPYGDLLDIKDPAERALAIRHKQNFLRAQSAIMGRLTAIVTDAGLKAGDINTPEGPMLVVEGLERKWRQLLKLDPDVGKVMYDVREGTGLSGRKWASIDEVVAAKTPQIGEEAAKLYKEVYESFVNIHDLMGDTLVKMGILQREFHNADDFLPKNYFYHSYDKQSFDLLDRHHGYTIGGPRQPDTLSAVFTKHRLFKNYEEAIDFSKTRAAWDDKLENATIAKGLKEGERRTINPYPKLTPDFDLYSNTHRYIKRYSQVIARKAWHEQVLHDFAVKIIGELDPNDAYKLADKLVAARSIEEITSELDEMQRKLARSSPGRPRRYEDLVREARWQAAQREAVRERRKLLPGKPGVPLESLPGRRPPLSVSKGPDVTIPLEAPGVVRRAAPQVFDPEMTMGEMLRRGIVDINEVIPAGDPVIQNARQLIHARENLVNMIQNDKMTLAMSFEDRLKQLMSAIDDETGDLAFDINDLPNFDFDNYRRVMSEYEDTVREVNAGRATQEELSRALASKKQVEKEIDAAQRAFVRKQDDLIRSNMKRRQAYIDRIDEQLADNVSVSGAAFPESDLESVKTKIGELKKELKAKETSDQRLIDNMFKPLRGEQFQDLRAIAKEYRTLYVRAGYSITPDDEATIARLIDNGLDMRRLDKDDIEWLIRYEPTDRELKYMETEKQIPHTFLKRLTNRRINTSTPESLKKLNQWQARKGKKLTEAIPWEYANDKAAEEIKRTWKLLQTDTGREAFMANLFYRSRSGGQFYNYIKPLLDSTPEAMDFLPQLRAIADGAPETSFAKWYGEAGSAYKAVTGGWVGKAGYEDGVMIPEVILKDLMEVDAKLINQKEFKAFGKLINGFDTLNNIFKLGVYSFWPASMVRDVYSNVFNSALDIGLHALNPRYHRDSILLNTILTAQGAKRQALLRKYGEREFYGWRLDTLSRLAEEFGVVQPGSTFAQQIGRIPEPGESFVRPLRSRVKQAMLDKRGFIENEARVVHWLANIRRGLDPRQAADKVAEFLFNYAELSGVEREFLRRFIPFYAFTRFNVALQTKMLLSNPGRSINQLKAFRPEARDSNWMVKWEAEALKLRLEQDGRTLRVMTGIDLPLRNLDNLYAGGVGATGRRIMGMVSPLLKVPIETVTGRDFFTGSEIKRIRADSLGRLIEATKTPQFVKDWIGYKKVTDESGKAIYSMDATRYSLLVKSWAFSRMFSTSDRVFREYVRDGHIAPALFDLATGIRVKDLNMDDQLQIRYLRRIRQLEESLVRRGVLAEFSRAFDPKNEIASY